MASPIYLIEKFQEVNFEIIHVKLPFEIIKLVTAVWWWMSIYFITLSWLSSCWTITYCYCFCLKKLQQTCLIEERKKRPRCLRYTDSFLSLALHLTINTSYIRQNWLYVLQNEANDWKECEAHIKTLHKRENAINSGSKHFLFISFSAYWQLAWSDELVLDLNPDKQPSFKHKT